MEHREFPEISGKHQEIWPASLAVASFFGPEKMLGMEDMRQSERNPFGFRSIFFRGCFVSFRECKHGSAWIPDMP